MSRTHRARRVAASIGALTLALFTFPATTRAATPADHAAADSAVAWLVTKQQPNGGFEQTAFEGFETTDAVLAIAEQAQTGPGWNTAQAFDAVNALAASGPGNPTPLDYLEDLVADATDQGVAAKNLVLVALPLGIDPTAFGSVNLVTAMGGCSGTETLGFNGFLYLVLAQELHCGGAPPSSIAAIRAGQQANGGWNFANDPSLDDLDTDTTAAAMQALIGAGAGPSDPAIRAALVMLAENQQANGAWQFFGADDPNSTAMAMIGIAAAGFDPTTPCWRNTVAPQLTGTPYARPDVWLRGQQQTSGPDAGQIGTGNTFATSQGVQGLLRSWVPLTHALAPDCATIGPAPTVSTTTPTAGASLAVSGNGFMPGASLEIELFRFPAPAVAGVDLAVHLATVTADGTGAYSVTVTIPSTAVPGVHELVVTGLGPDGLPRITPVELTVVAASGPSGGVTPRFTG